MRADVEPHDHPLGVREVADDLPDGRGEPPNEGRDREDLIALRELRVLHEIDHLDGVLYIDKLVSQDTLRRVQAGTEEADDLRAEAIG